MATLRRYSPSAAALLIVAAISLAAVVISLAAGCDEGPRPETPGPTAAEGTDTPISLRYSYIPGASWAHEAETVIDSVVDAALATGGEGSITSDETKRERKTVSVEDVSSDGAARLDVTYETLESIVDDVVQDLTVSEPRTALVTADPSGRVLAVEGGDDPNITSGTFDSAGFSRFFEYLDTSYDLTAVLFPAGGTAEVGEAWKSGYTIPLPGMGKELTVTTTAELVEVSTEDGRRVALIQHSSSLPLEVVFDLSAYYQAMLEGSSYSGDPASVVVKMTVEGEIAYSGTAKVDIATGRTISGEGRSVMTLALTYSQAPDELFPPQRRGPFAMDASGAVTIREVE
jgi:hypothetical protein